MTGDTDHGDYRKDRGQDALDAAQSRPVPSWLHTVPSPNRPREPHDSSRSRGVLATGVPHFSHKGDRPRPRYSRRVDADALWPLDDAEIRQGGSVHENGFWHDFRALSPFWG